MTHQMKMPYLTYLRKNIRYSWAWYDEDKKRYEAQIVDMRKGQDGKVLASFGWCDWDVDVPWSVVQEWAARCEKSAEPVKERIINELLAQGDTREQGRNKRQ